MTQKLNYVLCITVFLILNADGYTTLTFSPKPIVPQRFHPYTVAISRNGSLRKICAGVLLREDFILTAAQCVRSKSRVRVLLRCNRELVKIKPKAIHVHPFFSSRNLDYDVVLIELDKAAEVGRLVKPVEILATNISIDMQAVVTGFPIQTYRIPNFVRRDKLSILSQWECQRFNIFMRRTEMCASMSMHYLTHTLVRNIRFFNTGSPLVIERNDKYILVGIVSNKPWTRHGRIINFIRLGFYKKWIESFLLIEEDKSPTTEDIASAPTTEEGETHTTMEELSSTTTPEIEPTPTTQLEDSSGTKDGEDPALTTRREEAATTTEKEEPATTSEKEEPASTTEEEEPASTTGKGEPVSSTDQTESAPIEDGEEPLPTTEEE